MNYANQLTRQSRAMSALLAGAIALLSLCVNTVQAAVPGITGTSFNLTASADYITAPDGAMIYSWGYGCSAGFAPSFLPTTPGFPSGECSLMQLPGPTMIVHQGDTVTVNLTNALPFAAGNTSILFPGFDVVATGGVVGQLAQEASAATPVTYTFTASKPGTYGYHSGTRSDLQIEMGLYGALIVLPASSSGCTQGEYSLAASAYSDTAVSVNPTCYDREYLMQLSEMDINIHQQVEAQKDGAGPIVATMEPYVPQYFWFNGRSFPDNVDAAYSPITPRQPYNFAPQMHPGERMLIREVQQGRIEHPLHIHGNHARILARDGNLLLSKTDPSKLAGPQSFTFTAIPGQSMDSIFTWSGKGLGWDIYNHKAGDASVCIPDVNGYYTSNPLADNYGEWCGDHTKPIPVTPPDPSIVANGQYYGGSPYMGLSGAGQQTLLAPGVIKQNPGAAYCYPWHSHHERETTTNNVFPGGNMTIMCILPPSLPVGEL
jgi:FtsP/CotA-like multicopper oxidase with cupredoxin domain